MLNYDSPRELKNFLSARGIALKKRWGQNFMVSPGARRLVSDALAPMRGERIWEVGPGLGALSGALVELGVNLTLFEVDWAFVHVLTELFTGVRTVSIIPGDALRTWRAEKDLHGVPDAVCGNLPYNIAATLIGDFLADGFVPARSVFTVQREVARRMGATPGTSDYSGFSVLCQAHCDVRVLGDLAPGTFYPAPEVVSAAVSLRRRPNVPRDSRILAAIVRIAFSSRRKTIRNNVRASSITIAPVEFMLNAFRSVGVDTSLRAEAVSPDTFVAISEIVSERGAAADR